MRTGTRFAQARDGGLKIDMKTKYLGALFLLLAACSGKQVGGASSSDDTLALKKAAAEAASNDSSAKGDPVATPTDACAEHGWYGDGECDSFCPQRDTDCVSDGSGAQTVCATFVEVSDGKCSRAATDPCLFQDPDCSGQTPPSSGGGGTACATISEVSDGVCKRPDSDPCRFQDPDCTTGGGSDANPGGGTGDSGGSGGVACPALIELSNGKCERPASDPCRSIDPDCNVACAEYVEQSDGVCKRDANDPCIFQDPDCSAK